MPGPASPVPTASLVEASSPGADSTVETVQVNALGVAVDVTGLAPDEASAFRQAWSRCVIEPGQDAVGQVARISGDFARANEHLTSTITLTAIEELAGTVMMFHACGLADPVTGATVAFIAPSGTGKTTVARTLGPELGYVSDETIAVASDLRIVSYPKPLSVKQKESGVPKVQEGPDSFGLGATPAAPVLHRITLLSRAVEATPVSVEAVPLAAAILELTPQLSALSRMDRGLVQLCQMIQDCGGVRRIRYSEAAHIVNVLPDISAGPDADYALEWTPCELGVDTDSEAAAHGLRRASVQDAVEIDEVLFLLVNSTVVQLGPLGALLWQFSGSWNSREALLQRVTDEIGSHPSAAELLDSAIEELLSQGVLESA